MTDNQKCITYFFTECRIVLRFGHTISIIMQHLTLFELNELIKAALSEKLEPSYWVIAEIGELRMAQKGHCYLELVDKVEQSNDIVAKSRANIWSYAYRNISGWFEAVTGRQLQVGMRILANVQVQFHSLYGMSLNIRDIDPNYTLGERQRQRQATIERLKSDGVFEMNKALTIPLVPQRVVVISSAGAAGYGDFMNHIEGNEYGYQLNIELCNSLMQGNDAANSIIATLHQINNRYKNYDAVVIIRGGGAQVDLDCFDNYDLCTHLAQMPLPVITGIGHERDETIADMVAHTKMKTPTAVADFLIGRFVAYETKMMDNLHFISRVADRMIGNQTQQLSLYEKSIGLQGKSKLKSAALELENLQELVKRSCKQQLKDKFQFLLHREKELKFVDPDFLFEKGYSFTTINGIPLHKARQINHGDEMNTIGKEFAIVSKIIKAEKRDE